MRKILISILAVSLLLSGCVPRSAVKEDNKVSIENKEDIKEETPKEEDKTEKPKEEVKEEKKEQPKETPKVENKNTDKKVAATPKTTTTNKTTVTETKPQNTTPPAEQPKYDDKLHNMLESSTPNNGKFKITFNKISGPAPQGIIYYVDDFSYELYKNSKIKSYVVLNGRISSSNDPFYGFLQDESGNQLNKYKGFIGLNAYKDMPNKADLYVFITSVEDGKTYYEKVTYNITSVDVK